MRHWLAALNVETLFIEPGSPWENGSVESFNGKLRDELLDREIFYTLTEATILIERWRREYNTVRPHSALGYRPPAPDANRLAASANELAELEMCWEQHPLSSRVVTLTWSTDKRREPSPGRRVHLWQQ